MEWNAGGSPGTALAATPAGTLRTSRYGSFGEFGVYHRYETAKKWEPPYVFSGRIRPHSIMQPPVFAPGTGADGQTAWYVPALVFHPMYGSSTTPAKGNDENVLIGIGGHGADGNVGISAELRAERPERPYGVRTGYASRDVRPAPIPVRDGNWHDFEIRVTSHARYGLWWDGALIAEVVELAPTTMAGANGIGLRLDFADVEFDNLKVTQPPRPPTSGVNMKYIDVPVRGFDTRSGKRIGPTTVTVPLSKFRDIPANAEAVELTITALGADDGGFLTLWSGAAGRPNTSNLNFQGGPQAICNTTVTRCHGGKFAMFVSTPAHVFIDIIGYQ